MASMLDAFPYPWHEVNAQQLHLTLSQLHPTVQSALLVAQRAQIDTLMIDTQQPVFFVWKQILDMAATAGLTRHLVQGVLDLLNANNPRRPFLEGLLTSQPIGTEGELRSADGSPSFLRDNDEVDEPEALLYHDDLTIQIGLVPRLIATLQRLIRLAPAVCKFVVGIHGEQQYGSGFRIGRDLLLTNWHVLHRKTDDTRATVVTAEFGYEDNGQGSPLTPTVMPCDVTSIVSSQADDWAIIRTQQVLADKWVILKLSESVIPILGTAAYIIQHPDGQLKRLGFVRNQISFFDDRVVHYLTDTREGSSGSPVFDADGILIALHRAGGRPQEVVGRVPLKKNEGVRISQIVEGLKGRHIDIP